NRPRLPRRAQRDLAVDRRERRRLQQRHAEEPRQIALVQVDEDARRRAEERGLQAVVVAVQLPHAPERRLQSRLDGFGRREVEAAEVAVVDRDQRRQHLVRARADGLDVEHVDGVEGVLSDEVAGADLLAVDGGVVDARVRMQPLVLRRNGFLRLQEVAEDHRVPEEDDAAALVARMLAEVLDERPQGEEIGVLEAEDGRPFVVAALETFEERRHELIEDDQPQDHEHEPALHATALMASERQMVSPSSSRRIAYLNPRVFARAPLRSMVTAIISVSSTSALP